MTENPKDQRDTIFTMRDDGGRLMECRSRAGFDSVIPKIGDKIAIVGDTIRDIITRGESREFFFDSLEILESAQQKAA